MDDVEDTVDSAMSVKDKAKLFQKEDCLEQTQQRPASYTDPSTIPVDKEWCIISAKCDYHKMAKRLLENHLLSRAKDPISGYTALHWACKHGNMDAVKMLAGTYRASVDAMSHGGYTPLHVAAMFKHQDVYQLLTDTYGADINIRDHSGFRPSYYNRNLQDDTISRKRSSATLGDGLQIHTVINLEKKDGHFLRRESLKETADDTISITSYIKSGLESIRKRGRKSEEERPSVLQVVEMFESIDEEQSRQAHSALVGEHLARRYSADESDSCLTSSVSDNAFRPRMMPSLDTRRYSAGDLIDSKGQEEDKSEGEEDKDDLYNTLLKETFV